MKAQTGTTAGGDRFVPPVPGMVCRPLLLVDTGGAGGEDAGGNTWLPDLPDLLLSSPSKAYAGSPPPPAVDMDIGSVLAVHRTTAKPSRELR